VADVHGRGAVVDDVSKLVAFLYRYLWYISITLLFLYVLNIPRSVLPSATIVKGMALFFAILVIGGAFGMFFPSIEFVTPVESVMPTGLLRNVFVYDSTHATVAGPKAYQGLGIYRPKPFFAYTNQWGATYALALPFAIGALELMRSQLWRRVLIILLLLSVGPLLAGLNRGSWLSAAAVVGYSSLLLAVRRKSRMFWWVMGGVLLIGGVFVITGLQSTVTYRIESAQSTKSRALNYKLSTELTQASPWLGYGGTVQTEELNASVGTQGQLWTIMVSHGIPALILFLLWFLWCFWVSWRRPPPWADEKSVFWSHIVLFSAFSMLIYYEWLPYGFGLVMIAAAIVWREVRPIDGPGSPEALALRAAGTAPASV
jgi:polysaccharide biosynthesis protein PslJ